ncbi:hypothetical protein GGR50DRAFT_695276 [Xylaria sp. CBS 124048]|nr:hypothetical protein GGR50DRAFT_695276 [Xylaria sp. CBS 124048]
MKVSTVLKSAGLKVFTLLKGGGRARARGQRGAEEGEAPTSKTITACQRIRRELLLRLGHDTEELEPLMSHGTPSTSPEDAAAEDSDYEDSALESGFPFNPECVSTRVLQWVEAQSDRLEMYGKPRILYNSKGEYLDIPRTKRPWEDLVEDQSNRYCNLRRSDSEPMTEHTVPRQSDADFGVDTPVPGMVFGYNWLTVTSNPGVTRDLRDFRAGDGTSPPSTQPAASTSTLDFLYMWPSRLQLMTAKRPGGTTVHHGSPQFTTVGAKTAWLAF